MFLLYSILLSIGFLLVSPMLFIRREKYASGLRQRLGNYPPFKHDARDVMWLHCVSVGETNAARPLVDSLLKEFPDRRLVISTTTKTGQELAQKIFADRADAVVYFPFDWRFSVKRALGKFKPCLVLLMETEIWPRFIREAKSSGAKVAIVNGRLSQRSFSRYMKVRLFLRAVLSDVDLALMQTQADADRIVSLGIGVEKVSVTGNLKFVQTADDSNVQLTEEFRSRFGISSEKPLIIAASTHEPEEKYVIEALDGALKHSCRVMIVPRHPERFDGVARFLQALPYSFARRTAPPSETDKDADIILLDSIGELRDAYPLGEIVFVGGSLIPHGGQSILEPAVEGKAIVTGPYTSNFDAVVEQFLENDAIRQIATVADLGREFAALLGDVERRRELASNASLVMANANRDAAERTIEAIKDL